MQVRLNGYSNPTGRCGHSNICRKSGQLHCCDNPNNAGRCSDHERCDSYFIYCLRPFGEVQRTTSSCFSGKSTPFANTDDGPLDFSQSTVLGLNNPLNLSGLQGAYDVSIIYTFSHSKQ